MTDDAVVHSVSPLNAFRHVQTDNLASLEEAVRRYYPAAKFEFGSGRGKLNAVANRAPLRDVALTYGRHGTRLRIRIPSLEAYSLLFSFNGSAGARARGTDMDVSGDRALLVSAGEEVNLDYTAEFEQLILSVPREALASKLEALTGEPIADRIMFRADVDFRRPAAGSVRRLFMFVVNQLSSRESDLHPLVIAELEQALVVSLLTANDSNYSLLLNRSIRSAAPWQVRKVEAYIEANWDQPLTIEALALVAGASARSLFHAFRRARGYSPMDFAKRVRLDHARRMLNEGNGASVTAVAFACGFGNLGHFATYYRRAFGESPSATRRRLS